MSAYEEALQQRANGIANSAKVLVERLYMVRLRFRDSLTTEEIKAYGMPTTGDGQYDQGMYDDNVDRYVNIFTMLQYFREGIPFRIAVHSETKEIYEAVSDYLYSCKHVLENVLNAGGLDVELLLALDRFAASIYDHAVEHFPNEFVQSKMLRTFASFRAARLEVPRQAEPGAPAEEKQIKRHVSLSNALIQGATQFKSVKFNG